MIWEGIIWMVMTVKSCKRNNPANIDQQYYVSIKKRQIDNNSKHTNDNEELEFEIWNTYDGSIFERNL